MGNTVASDAAQSGAAQSSAAKSAAAQSDAAQSAAAQSDAVQPAAVQSGTVRSGATCSIAATTDVIGDRWTLLILRTIFRGHHRFSDILDDVGIARNLLSNRLHKLVDHGVLERIPYQERPVRHEYRLTAKGAELSPALVALMRWGDTWYADGAAPVELYHDPCGTAVTVGVRCPHCHDTVRPTDISSRPGGHLA